MSDTRFQKAKKAEQSAEKDLEDADAWASKRGIYGAKQQAREMRRGAKRRRAKARRRQNQELCEGANYEDVDYEDEDLRFYEEFETQT